MAPTFIWSLSQSRPRTSPRGYREYRRTAWPDKVTNVALDYLNRVGPTLSHPGVRRPGNGGSSRTARPSRRPLITACPHGLIESTNTKIRVLTRIAHGFTNPETLMARAMLVFGGYPHAYPDRATAK
jgi:Transposase